MEGETSGKRTRRSTRFNGDYSFNFAESSEEEIEIEDKKKKIPASVTKAKKTKECPGCGANVPISLRECRLCDYQFTSKSMLVGQVSAVQESQNIRDKFPFEPEKEEDGTLIIQNILGRRARKSGKRWVKESGGHAADMTAMESKYDYEYLIKFKSLSYMHVQWLSAGDIEALNQKSKSALNRYLTKLDKGDANVPEDGEIDPSYLEVEKVLDYREEEVEEIVDDITSTAHNQQVLKDLEKVKAVAEAGGDIDAVPQLKSIDAGNAEEKSEEGEEVAEGKDNTAKTPTQIFQAVERCRKVLEKIWEDPFASSFQDPVDTSAYDDYLDIVEEPICLGDVLAKLDNGEYNKYMQYKQFAQDMRKIWRNCKLYNVYKSPIWHSANYLSMLFERLYQAWVVSFSDGTIPMSNSVARPWETQCRVCNEENNDDQIMLCDHCDAAYHVYCLNPPLPKVPEDAWMCKRCMKWLARTGAKVLSATVEEDARQLVEGATTKKIIRVIKKKYLVKWRGLSYRESTWETAEDIKDDEKIAEYHKLNDSPPDEPPLTQAEIGVELAKDRKSQPYPTGYNGSRENPVIDLDAQIYAQIRSYHFLKWNKFTPDALLNESGPCCFASTHKTEFPFALPKSVAKVIDQVKNASKLTTMENTSGETSTDAEDTNSHSSNAMEVTEGNDETVAKIKYTKEEIEKDSKKMSKPSPFVNQYSTVVHSLVAEMVYAVARDYEKAPIDEYPSRPRIPSRYQVPSEIEICVPKGASSLCMRVGNYHDNVVVLGFRPFDNRGNKGPVERLNRIKPGDILIGINGVYVQDLKFTKILKLLSSCTQPFMYLRFLRIPACVESKTSSVVETYFRDKISNAKKAIDHLPEYRSRYFGVFPSSSAVYHECWNTTPPTKWIAAYHREHAEIIVGLFDDEETAAKAYDEAISKESKQEGWNRNFQADGELTATAKVLHGIVAKEHEYILAQLPNSLDSAVKSLVEKSQSLNSKSTTDNNESTENENNDDEDTVDVDFADFQSLDDLDTVSELSSIGDLGEEDSRANGDNPGDADEYRDNGSLADEDDEELEDDDEENEDEENDDHSENEKRNKWSAKHGDVAWTPKDSSYEPEGPMGRLLRAVNESEYAPIRSDWTKFILELAVENNKAVTTTNSSRGKKIEQVDMAANSVIRVWNGMLMAARSLNIPVSEIYAALNDKKDSAGGFKWRYSTEVLESAQGEEDGEDAEEKKDDSWLLKLPHKSKEYKNGGALRDYQVEGLNWLLRCWYTKKSSILADEMGLGKTVQVVSFLDHLYETESIRGPFLICVPLSTIGHWKREVEGWTNMQCCVYHDVGGGRDMRDVIREYEWYFKGRSRRLLKFHILITTYDDLTRDYEELAEIPWRVVIVDEAHRLRNVNSKLLECMRSVVLKGQVAYGYQHRILMTGTPLQNNTIELWSLLNFIEPAKFPDLEKFQQRFGKISTQEQVEHLQRRIGPHLLRRVKEDVAKDIPPKEETIIDVELTTLQKQYYRAIYEHNHSFLVQNLKGNIPKLMNIQMELRKCCNHPFLINGVEQTEMESLESKIEASAESVRGTARSKLLFDQKEFERKRMEEILVPASGKMVLLDKLLPKLKNEGHKVLIFSQMVKMIDLIEEFCEFRHYSCFRLDGRVSGNDRQKLIDRYNKEENSFVFLLSTRAGGVGINLTAADTVVIFDSDWNPQNDIQAMARCHRIGQSKNVKIYRLITRRSFESDMFERASKKLGLEQAVLGTRNFNEIDWDETNANSKSQINMDAKDMEKLLREGAYSLLLEDNENEIRDFYEQDIEQILEQRAHVLVEQSTGQGTESWLNKRKKLGKTSKRLFTGESAKEHAEIDVDDPDFWKKVLPDLVTPDTMLERLKDDSLVGGNEDDYEQGREQIEKFMKDLSQMMDGMLDLSRRNQLPEHERAVCLKLLLRITLKDDVFDEDERMQAQDWLSMIEGTRSRRGRQDVYQVEDIRRPKTGRGRGRGRGGGRGGRGGRGGAASNRDGSDEDEDEDDRTPKRRGRKPKNKSVPEEFRDEEDDDHVISDGELVDEDDFGVDDDASDASNQKGKGKKKTPSKKAPNSAKKSAAKKEKDVSTTKKRKRAAVMDSDEDIVDDDDDDDDLRGMKLKTKAASSSSKKSASRLDIPDDIDLDDVDPLEQKQILKLILNKKDRKPRQQQQPKKRAKKMDEDEEEEGGAGGGDDDDFDDKPKKSTIKKPRGRAASATKEKSASKSSAKKKLRFEDADEDDQMIVEEDDYLARHEYDHGEEEEEDTALI